MVDMALYNITLYLAFVAAGFPAGVYSSIWTQISGGLTVPVTSISLLRAMIAAGGVLACILSVRTSQKRERIFDLCLAGVSLETLGARPVKNVLASLSLVARTRAWAWDEPDASLHRCHPT